MSGAILNFLPFRNESFSDIDLDLRLLHRMRVTRTSASRVRNQGIVSSIPLEKPRANESSLCQEKDKTILSNSVGDWYHIFDVSEFQKLGTDRAA